MCGLSGYFARESSPNRLALKLLFNEGAKRGTDGFGYCHYSEKDGTLSEKKYSGSPDYSIVIDTIGTLGIGDVLISNSRAAPETESEVSLEKLNATVQPISLPENGLSLVHNGAVSNFIVNELRNEYPAATNIDSEAILHAYLKFGRNMQMAMEYLSGGFAFLMMDSIKKKLYAVCSHNPLYVGYVRGHGMFFSSTEEGVFSVVSFLKGISVTQNTMSVWEDYYAHRLPEYSIQEIDLESGMVNHSTFQPRYTTNTFDWYEKKKTDKPVVLVAASSGLDSSTTLATLKAAGMNPIAVHFNYGHRGGVAEELSIKKIVEILDVPIYKFDLSEAMSILDSGMLTDKSAKIITGTDAGLKTTAAWTVYRNHFFMTYMGALAESLIMKDNYTTVYLTGGFMQLSESGSYPDNSERFIDSAMKFFKFSITGTRLKPLYGMCNILKTEQYFLLDKLGLLEKLSPWLISCDRPIVQEDENGEIVGKNCSKNGKPACGSGLLSFWASKIAGVADTRRYYEVDDPEYVAYEPNTAFTVKTFSLKSVVNRIEIPEQYKKNLIDYIKKIGE